MTSDPADLREAVCQRAARAGQKLHRKGGVTSVVEVFVRINTFQLDQAQYRNSVVVALIRPTYLNVDAITLWPISRQVNRASEEGAELVTPIDL